MPQRLFLVDGSALYYRSYFAFIKNPLINSKGENTSATFGFLSSLLKLIEDERPEFLAVVFDTKEPTFRHKLFDEYKATREKMPEDMAAQYPRLVSTLKAFNFVLLEKVGYEADDLIGTLARRFGGEDLDVLIVSGDKDMAQLVNEHVFLYSLPKAQQTAVILDARAVRQKMSVEPQQVIDWLALMGDSSDNIPGVPKVGEVTAAKFLQQFGSLDGLYENIHSLKEGVIKNNLLEFRGQTALAKQLATIHTDVPLEVSLDLLSFRIWDMAVVEPVLQELEFRRLAERMKALAQNLGVAKDFVKHDEKKANYQLIDSMEKFRAFFKKLAQQEEFVFDLETSALDFLSAEIAGIAFSWQEKQGFYVALHHPDGQLDETAVFQSLKPLFENPHIRKIGQNIKFDAMILEQHGLLVNGLHFDTMLASYLLNPTGQHNLDALAEKYLGYEMIHIEELIGSGKKQQKMTDLSAGQVAVYAVEDADITWQLYGYFKPRLTEMGMDELFHDLEMPLVRVLMTMETQGVALDLDLLAKQSRELSAQIQRLELSIYQTVGRQFNLNSPQQLGLILFDQLKIHEQLGRRKPGKTKTGQYSTTEKILERFTGHPLAANIVEYRKLTKLKNTYIDALPTLINPKSGRVHTSYNQAVAATGRLSSSNPNLQNIPIRSELGRDIRKAFIPSQKDYVILSADYSQIELRLVAHLSQDQTMMDSFKKREDIHAATAAWIFQIPLNQVNADQRRKAKEINFGIIYGMSRYGLADRLNISTEEAEMFIYNYMATYPKIGEYMTHCIEQARRYGYVETMMHRRRYLTEIKSSDRQTREFAERTAINTPIQGSAADMIKKAMIDIHHFIGQEKIPARMLLQVHDELVFEVKKNVVDDFAKQVKSMMEQAFTLDVPVVVECGIGSNWLEAH